MVVVVVVVQWYSGGGVGSVVVVVFSIMVVLVVVVVVCGRMVLVMAVVVVCDDMVSGMIFVVCGGMVAPIIRFTSPPSRQRLFKASYSSNINCTTFVLKGLPHHQRLKASIPNLDLGCGGS